MTATLTFDLNDHDDRQAHMRCVKALDMALVLWEIDTRLSRATSDIIITMDHNKHALLMQGVELAMSQFRDLMIEHSIDLNDLIS